MNMENSITKKNHKTFPIDLDIDIHKALKVMAIESDITLHALITKLLSLAAAEYRTKHTQVTKYTKDVY